MKKGKKLAILIGTTLSALSLTGCKNSYIYNESEYKQKVNELSTQIKNDMKEVGLDVYKYEILPENFNPADGNISWNGDIEDYYIIDENNSSFLALPNDIIVENIESNEEKALVVYSITNSDAEYINSLGRTRFCCYSPLLRHGYAYYGAIDGLLEVVKKDTSKLYSVENLTTKTVLYSAESQQEMENDGMSL